MASRVVEVMLPNKTVALVRAVELDEREAQGTAEKVGWKDQLDFEHVSGMLEGVAQAVRSGLVKVTPARTTVELGIELAVKNGKLTGMLVEGAANASLKVTLEWGSDQPGNGSGSS
jgi:Trypsin-co-occurring domain 1